MRVLPGPEDEVAGVFVVAAYPSSRAGLRALVEQTPGFVVLADGADDVFDTSVNPDVLVIDVDPGRPTVAARLAARYPDAALLLLLDDPRAYRTLDTTEERATAVLLRNAGAEEIGAALRGLRAGLVVLDPAIARELAPPAATYPRGHPGGDEELVEPLTERERQVLELLALGLPNKTIAAELGISEHTAKFHVGAILSKLGAASRTEAVAIAARRGLLVL